MIREEHVCMYELHKSYLIKICIKINKTFRLRYEILINNKQIVNSEQLSYHFAIILQLNWHCIHRLAKLS